MLTNDVLGVNISKSPQVTRTLKTEYQSINFEINNSRNEASQDRLV